MSYTAPVKDMLFAIKHLARIDEALRIKGPNRPRAGLAITAGLVRLFGGKLDVEVSRE